MFDYIFASSWYQSTVVIVRYHKLGCKNDYWDENFTKNDWQN